MAVERKKFEFDEEKFIITNLILITDLCKDILPITEPSYFKSKGIHTIIGWMKTHYAAYGEAIGTKISEYYDINANTLDSGVKEQIHNILEHLSAKADNEVHNIAYLKDRALALYRKKFYENQIKAANIHIENGHVDRAEEALATRFNGGVLKSQAKRLDDSDLLNESIESLFRSEEKDVFFRFEGRLGEFLPDLEQGWLVSFVAPPKTGKTVMLIETVVSAVIQRKNVVFFSFEMPLKQILTRVTKRITGMASPEGGTYEVPVFDCVKNQEGSCILSTRTGSGDLCARGGSAVYDPDKRWTVCTACRGKQGFIPATWKEKVEKSAVTEAQFRTRVNAFMKYYAKYCRSIFHPSRTANAKTLISDLDALIQDENFIPDLVVIDYADLLTTENGGGVKRLELDDIWESLRSLGQDRMALVVTASQTSKGAVEAKYIRPTDIAEDFSKIAKVDLGIGLAQTEEMKLAGILNANMVASRHGAFIVSNVCSILQDPKAMQGVLDSDF
jgi:replicative DNA helicase